MCKPYTTEVTSLNAMWRRRIAKSKFSCIPDPQDYEM